MANPMNWAVSTVTMWITLILIMVSIIIAIREYIKTKYPHFIYMCFTWIFLWLGNLFLVISYLFLDIPIYKIGIILTIPSLFFIIMMVDSISKEKTGIYKLVLSTIISCFMIFFAFDDNSVIINISKLNEQTPAMRGNFSLATSALFTFSGIYWFYYMAKLYIHTPQQIKKISRINLIGAILAGPGALVLFISGLVWFIPGIDYLFMGIGSLLCSYSFSKEPKLGYILPFQVQRLLVINLFGGKTIFSYDWDDSEIINKPLFASIITGIISLLKNSFTKWSIQEIRFDKGIVILSYEKGSNIISILITSKSSSILKYSLETFSKKFKQKYKEILNKNSVDLQLLSSANDLINDTFPYIISSEDNPSI